MKIVMNKQSIESPSSHRGFGINRDKFATQVTILASDGSPYIGTMPSQVSLSINVNAEKRN